MKYKLAQFLLQKEICKASAGHAGTAAGPGSVKELKKGIAGNPGSQFKYCWQSNDGKHMNDSDRLNRIFKNPEIK